MKKLSEDSFPANLEAIKIQYPDFHNSFLIK